MKVHLTTTGRFITDDQNRFVAELTSPHAMEMGPLIVHAVNCHSPMKTALEAIKSQTQGHCDEFSCRVFKLAQDALFLLQRAEGQKEGKP